MIIERGARISLVGAAVGAILTLAEIGVGVGATIGNGEANLSAAFSIGHRRFTRSTLPEYVAGRIGDSNDLCCLAERIPILDFEQTGLLLLGNQGAPSANLHLAVEGRAFGRIILSPRV